MSEGTGYKSRVVLLHLPCMEQRAGAVLSRHMAQPCGMGSLKLTLVEAER